MLLALSALAKHNFKQPEIHLKQVKIILNKLNIFTYKYAGAQLSTFGQKEI